MKFNPNTNRLFTDADVLIKKLDCPFRLDWGKLSFAGDLRARLCNLCEKSVIDTDGLSDEAVAELVRRDPTVCLKVAFDQTNIRVVNHGV